MITAHDVGGELFKASQIAGGFSLALEADGETPTLKLKGSPAFAIGDIQGCLEIGELPEVDDASQIRQNGIGPEVVRRMEYGSDGGEQNRVIRTHAKSVIAVVLREDEREVSLSSYVKELDRK